MDKTYNDLKKIIKSYLTHSKYNDNNRNINDIYKLSNLLNVSNVVGYTLKKNNKYDSIFDKSIYKSLKKYSLFLAIKKQIKEMFDKENIKYIFLKGESIARYYEEPYLRYSSDLDIIIYKDDYSKALDLLIDRYAFKIKQQSLNEITLVNKDGINIDFHKRFELDNEEIENLFDNCFEKNELDDDYKYIYLLDHEAKHFVTGQLDLRFFVDLFYLRTRIDKINVNFLLKKVNLFDFDKRMNMYLDYLLSLNELSDDNKKIDNYILSYAKDQGASNRVNNNSNKVIYFIRHAFPSFNVMRGVFPLLDKYPILLPWFYIVRIVKMLKSDRRKYVVNEFKSSFIGNNNELINELGISSYNK